MSTSEILELEGPCALVLAEGLDDDDPWCHPVHHITQAATSPRPVIGGPRSVFDLVDWTLNIRLAQLREDAAEHPKAERALGITRVVGAQYPNNRWTEERQLQEEARRARQRPPRSSWGKRRSKKFAALLGEAP